MPYNTNNVDMSVNANSIFGLNSLLTSLPMEESQKLFGDDMELRGMHLNTTHLLEYGIRSGIVMNRTDLALTYYPSEFDFFWFVARNVHLLRSHKLAKGSLPFSELELCLSTLQSAMEEQGVQQLLSVAHSTEFGTQIYWEGFMGNYANKTRHEDRLFSTAVTLNALIDLYSVTSPDRSTRQWIQNMPQNILSIIQKGISFILHQTSDPKISYMNAFFSGSSKGQSSMPFFFPANFGEYMNNGTRIDPSQATFKNVTDQYIEAFQGTVTDQQYQQLINQTWFGQPTPTRFDGFNAPHDSFAFWSSKSITYIIIIQALAKYSSLS